MKKIIANINVFKTGIEDRVSSKAHSRLIVNKNNCKRVHRNTKLRKKFLEPDCFASCLNKNYIFGFYS